MTDRGALWLLLALGAGRALAEEGCAVTDGESLGPPAFVVDGSDPTRHGSAIFVSTASGAAVRGRLERFRLRGDGAIVDAAGALATDPSGRIKPGAPREWPADAPAAPLYTDLVPGPLRVPANVVSEGNAALGTPELGLGPSDAALPRPLVLAVRGGGDVVLLATADGLLRAVDAASGTPLWSFAPRERLGRGGASLAASERRPGSISVMRIGNRDAAPRRLGVFAGGAGSSSYVGLDLSDPRAPVVLWRAGPAELPGAATRRASASLARIRIAGVHQNADAAVLVAAGGEDDPASPRAGRGNRLFVIDLASGALLWRAGPAAPAKDLDPLADLKLARLDAALAAEARVLDLDGDGFADRIYAADLAGRVWRFDVHNGADAAHLVTGTVLASLGRADFGGGASDARRFPYAPDAAFLRDGAQGFVQVALGSASGAAGVQDYFFALRDYDSRPLDAATAGVSGWNPQRVLRNDAALAEAGNAVPPERSHGWRRALGHGESVDGAARTFAGALLFTTTTVEAGGACSARHRLYVLDARSGRRLEGRDAEWHELPPGPRALPVVFAFPPRARGAAAVCAPGAVGCTPAAVCFVGLAACGSLPALAPIRTIWSELGASR